MSSIMGGIADAVNDAGDIVDDVECLNDLPRGRWDHRRLSDNIGQKRKESYHIECILSTDLRLHFVYITSCSRVVYTQTTMIS